MARDDPLPPRPVWSQPPPDSDRPTFVFSEFAIHGGNADLCLPEGETVIGRALDSGVVIDSPVVSRRHAVLTVRGSKVEIRDLDSRNGVFVNGTRCVGSRPLEIGDTFAIGDVIFTLQRQRNQLVGTPGASSVPKIAGTRNSQSSNPLHDTSQTTRFDLLRSVAEKALALGHHEEVVRLLDRPIRETHASVMADLSVDADQVEEAAAYAIRIAINTRNVDWAVLALEMVQRRGLLLPANTVDRLYALVRRLQPHQALLHAYVEAIAKRRERLSASERFALKRLEGLERLIAL